MKKNLGIQRVLNTRILVSTRVKHSKLCVERLVADLNLLFPPKAGGTPLGIWIFDHRQHTGRVINRI